MTDQRTRDGTVEDRRFVVRWRENFYRDIWLLLISGVVLATVISIGTTVQRVNRQQHAIDEGRSIAIAATCAVESAIVLAGRNVILGGGRPLPRRMERFLERLGYPPARVRARAAVRAARAYGNGIALAVARTLGPRGLSIVRDDGTLDCRRLQQLARAPSLSSASLR